MNRTPPTSSVLHDQHDHDHQEWCPPLDPRLNRRAALRLLSMSALATVAGCGTNTKSATASSSSSESTSTSTVGQTWLRGYQITDSTGKVQFTTIVPGWYSGRTTHIHLRLRSTYDSTDNGGTNTMQLFFDQTLIDTLATSVSPYSSEGKNPTTNATDHVYSGEENGTTLLTLTGSTSEGYAASFNIHLPIASA